METVLLGVAVVLFLVSGLVGYAPGNGSRRYAPTLRDLGLAAFAGAFLVPLL